MSDSEEPLDLADEGDDLFGDEDDAGGSPRAQVLSDKDLDSDAERANDAPGYGSDEEALRHQDKVIASIPVFRHRTPKSKDGTIQSLKVPEFIKFVPEPYESKTFEPSAWDVENAKGGNKKIAVRYYNDPETGELKSNAMMYKWSDGSVSMSVGDQHFAIQKKATVPPPNKPYNELQDAHSYAAAAHLSSGLFLVVGHIAEEYTVRLNKDLEDDALQRLAMRMREAKAKDEASRIIKTTHDPELQRRLAEMAEKENVKAQRRRDNAAAKTDGGSRYSRGGLQIDDLEGSRRASGAGRKRGMGGGKPKRRRPEYDSDDERPAGARQQEDYDLADDFIAPSDDEEEVEDDDDEEELLDDDDDEDEKPRSKRPKTTDASDEEDADGEEDDDTAPAASGEHAGRARRRNIIDDDDE